MQIGILGPFEVRTAGGDRADVPGARLRGLLVALALNPGHVVSKATLVDWIWDEQPPADATNALQRLVSRLRKALPDGAIEGQTDGYRLMVPADAVDAVRFERLLQAGRTGEALALWRGSALEDVGLQGSAAFDAAATRLDGLRLTAREQQFEADIERGRGAELVAELQDLVAAHPLRERLVAALMRALVAAGRNSDALMVYQHTRESLADALGVDPSAELSALHTALLRGEVGRGGDEDRRTNLRAELTSFVGREAEVAAVRALVAGHRLTTLTGPGGAGKTRLATETARAMLGEGGLPDGAWLIELAAVVAGGDVAPAALSGLGLRDELLGAASNADPVDRLVTAIRDREALLILDNCEHVIEQAAAFAHRLLGECRRLRILATSREPLGITGEALWLVEPLAAPGAEASTKAMEHAPAVQLLRDRASAVRSDLMADVHTLATMARICRALDGMPLAIELAAARLRTLTVEQLANRLDDRFRLLTGGSRTALPRHRTLRAMVDWSWELLSDAERAVLRRLSVFASGASLEAAERVCAGGDVEPEDVIELLTALAEKSLLRTAGEGAPRYRMLGTIKEYAAQRLAEAAETAATAKAHLVYFTELAEAAEPHLRRAEQLEWLAVYKAEHDEIGAALRGALAAGDGPAAMRLAAGAGWYWWLAGYKAEGLELLVAATELPGPDGPAEVRAIVYGIVSMYVTSGRSGEQQAADWIRRAAEADRNSRTHHPLSVLIAPMERMLAAPDDSLPAFESLLGTEDPWARALARLQLGKMRIMLGVGGDEADAYLATALAEFRGIGERFGISFALTELADRIAMRGELERACEYYREAIAVLAEIGAGEDTIRVRARQAKLYWLLGDHAAAQAAVAESDRAAERVTWPDALADLALTKADLARWAGDAAQARRLLGVATGLLGAEAEEPHNRLTVHDLLGYLAEDIDEARAHRAAAWQAAEELGYGPMVGLALIGVADLALRLGRDEQAARLLGAVVAVRGIRDCANPDEGRIEAQARRRLGDEQFTEAAREGAGMAWPELVALTLAG
ncbi:winged helix-turn-helix domain-containing protein [Dactylosporangium vinaceum]|uniref:BTAD domain-containing putative transcriptional regulator n=1 Tax=Dactylosporangium vinaceum TaxID=53362 RepID=A0ABV5MFY4_9ACTN|nr:BTAD domain-containing putative transcriptional regulator [Dactylosporangium vinaceum]UAB98694.1 winged helix-turn-helix domain-containing protein [Dactylosporangium vinaceum]